MADPGGAWRRGILEPLAALRRVGKVIPQPILDTTETICRYLLTVCAIFQISGNRCVILVDGLCQAEYHRPDTGDTLGSFIARHAHAAPSWLKFILTVRTHMDEVMPAMPFQKLR